MDIWKSGFITDLKYDLANEGIFFIRISQDENTAILVETAAPLFFSISSTIDDYAPPFFADLFLEQIEKSNAYNLMLKKGYQWMEPIDFPESIWHLHVEGGVVIDVFSEKEFLIQSKDL